MPAPTWLIDGSCARLNLPHLQGTLDSTQPALGLAAEVEAAAASDIAGHRAKVLGVCCSALKLPAQSLVDWYVRGEDLVAVYEIGLPDPARLELSWRAAAGGQGAPWRARIDLLVSVQTGVLDWRYAVQVQGDLPGAYVVQELGLKSGGLVFDWDDWSYAEFARWTDLRREDQLIHREGDGSRLVRRLFVHDSLEKGVILRARLRGLFFPAGIRGDAAADCYQSFMAEDPPLSI